MKTSYTSPANSYCHLKLDSSLPLSDCFVFATFVFVLVYFSKCLACLACVWFHFKNWDGLCSKRIIVQLLFTYYWTECYLLRIVSFTDLPVTASITISVIRTQVAIWLCPHIFACTLSQMTSDSYYHRFWDAFNFICVDLAEGAENPIWDPACSKIERLLGIKIDWGELSFMCMAWGFWTSQLNVSFTQWWSTSSPCSTEFALTFLLTSLLKAENVGE